MQQGKERGMNSLLQRMLVRKERRDKKTFVNTTLPFVKRAICQKESSTRTIT